MNNIDNVKQYVKKLIIPVFDKETKNAILIFLSNAETLEEPDYIKDCFNPNSSIYRTHIQKLNEFNLRNVLLNITVPCYGYLYNALLDKLCSLIWTKTIIIESNKRMFEADCESYCEALSIVTDGLPFKWLENISMCDVQNAILFHRIDVI